MGGKFSPSPPDWLVIITSAILMTSSFLLQKWNEKTAPTISEIIWAKEERRILAQMSHWHGSNYWKEESEQNVSFIPQILSSLGPSTCKVLFLQVILVHLNLFVFVFPLFISFMIPVYFIFIKYFFIYYSSSSSLSSLISRS